MAMTSIPKASKSAKTWPLATMGLWLLIALVGLSGCDVPPRPILKEPKDNKLAAEKAKKEAEIVEAPRQQFVGDWETWYAHYMNNSQVGYSHITAGKVVEESVVRSSKANVRYMVEDQVKFRRGNSTLIQHLSQTSTETPKGVLLNFDSSLRFGPLFTQYNGSVTNDQLLVETVRGSSRTTERLPWQSVFRGLQAVEQSLRRKPMELAETRNLKMLVPLKHQIATVKLFCSGESATGLLDGSYQKLTEIVSEESIDDKTISEQVLWVDENGVVLKSLRPRSGLTSYRTDKETVMSAATPINEVLATTSMDVEGTIERPADSMRVAYVVGPSVDVQRVKGQVSISPAPGQFVRKLADNSWQVLVTRHRGGDLTGFQAMEATPVSDDTKPNAFIDSNAPTVRNIANTATRKSMAEREMAIELTKTVNNLISQKSLSQGFTKASQILLRSEGGCKELSVLLAALLRNKGIPSRLAVGLIFKPATDASQKPTMNFHMWTVAYVDSEWISLDAMKGDYAPADRITLLTTNLAGGNEHKILAPVMAAFGRLKVEIRKATY